MMKDQLQRYVPRRPAGPSGSIDDRFLPRPFVAAALAVLIVLTAGGVRAQEPQADDAKELNKKTQNPVSDLISLPFQFNFNFGAGLSDDRHLFNLNIQPVVPVRLSESWNLVNRVILPILSVPIGLQNRKSGLGDLSYTAFFSPFGGSALTWGFGPAFQIPTATSDPLGSGKWSIGPSIVALVSRGQWVVGGLANMLWSFAGNDERGAVKTGLFQPFVNFNMAGGWAISTSPIITVDWKAQEGERWTVPLGMGVSKVLMPGGQPVSTSLQAYYNVERPSLASDWTLRATVSLLFPK